MDHAEMFYLVISGNYKLLHQRITEYGEDILSYLVISDKGRENAIFPCNDPIQGRGGARYGQGKQFFQESYNENLRQSRNRGRLMALSLLPSGCHDRGYHNHPSK